MALETILQHKQELLKRQKQSCSLEAMEEQAQKIHYQRRSLKEALSRSKDIHLICELKKASPSKGVIRQNFDPEALAVSFEKGGASAISVLTEDKFFMGSSQTPKRIRPLVTLPLLRKDFILEPYHVFESVTLEVDAILLIVSILSDEMLKTLIDLAKAMQLDTLVEIHSSDELKRALEAGATTIGINARDLTTFKIDPNVPKQLLKEIPESVIAVVESGIETHKDICNYLSCGAHHFLIGTTLMASQELDETLSQLLGRNCQKCQK